METISPQHTPSVRKAVPGLFLQFARHNLPSAATLQRVVEDSGYIAISHDFAAQAESPETEDGNAEQQLFELLVDGLTFDVSLSRQGIGAQFGGIVQELDVPPGDSGGRHGSLRLLPGPHLSGAEGSLPVIRTQMRIAASLLRALDHAEAAIWPPAASAMGKNWFVANIEAWLAGSPFPAPGLVSFARALGGAIQSRGLAFLTGQELRIEGDLAGDGAAATRLGIRLVDLLVHRGRLTATERLTGPAGEPLVLEPSTNSRFVRVWPG